MFCLFKSSIRFIIFKVLLLSLFFYQSRAAVVFPSSVETMFGEAMVLFEQQKYFPAQTYFENYLTSNKSKLNQKEASYYALLAALKNNDPHLEAKLQYFILLYPTHKYIDDVRYHLAKYFFKKGAFYKSCLLYESVDVDRLLSQEVEVFYYELGMTYLQLKAWEKAKSIFSKIHNINHAIYYPSKLQVAYIALEQEDYAHALVLLQEIETNSQDCATEAQSLRLKLYYKSNDFEALIDYVNRNAIQTLAKTDQLLVADAYFFLEQYATCISHYDTYLSSMDVVDRSTISKLAYALYRVGDYVQALDYFKRLLDKQDAIGQLANYYIGLIFTNFGRIQQASSLFDQAAQQNYNPVIQELALIRKAALLYSQGDFKEVVAFMHRFMQQYPGSHNILIAQTLLVQAYCKIKDYKLAADLLETISCKNETLLGLYQFVLFHQGLECYNNGLLAEAIQFFKQSIAFPIKKAVLSQTKFWMAEALSSILDYQPALTFYTEFIQQDCGSALYYERALYGLGYVYFNLGNYDSAAKTFDQYLKLTKQQPSTTYYDSLLRLGDCYYVKKRYKQALAVYDSVYNYNPAHVCYYQALIYNILDDRANEKKCIQKVLTVYRDTKYYIPCLYHEACSVFKRGDYETAIQKFTFLIQNALKNDLKPACLMKRALAYENLKKNKQAITDYIAILEHYPNCSEVENAFMALSNLFTLEGTPEKINPYLEKHAVLTKKNTASSEQRIMDSAKAFFYSQEYNKVLQHLGAFVKQYPDSKLRLEAYFLIAESYFRLKNLDQAINFYKKVLIGPQTNFHTKSWMRMAHIAYQGRRFQEALSSYQKLQSIALSHKESYTVLLGIAKTSFELKKYDNTTSTCLQLLDLSKTIPLEILQEAYLLLGKVALQRCEYKHAKNHFLKAQTPKHTRIGQEAQYSLACAEFKLKAYRSSLNILFNLTENPTHRAYMDKAFLLIADNYIGLGSFEQAKVTLNSIIKQSKDKKTIALAKKKMQFVVSTNKVMYEGSVKKKRQVHNANHTKSQ